MRGGIGRLAVGLLLAFTGILEAVESPLAEIDARFTPQGIPVCMEYDVGYRFLNLELARVGKVIATTTIGKWHHRVTGEDIPALFLDIKVNSPDSGKTGERNRVSIHDRIVAVLTVPEMNALLFAKYTDEYLHPLIGRKKETVMVSVYDVQAGRMDYSASNLQTGVITTNLANPEALLELSQRIKPVTEFLVSQHRAPTKEAVTSDKGRIVANLDGRVVALRILTKRDRSPNCFEKQHLDSTCIVPVAERGSSVKPRDFHAWSLDFKSLATTRNDEELIKAAQDAPVESVVPVVMDYELGLGTVRATMTSIHMGVVLATNRHLVVSKSPKPVSQEKANTN